MVAARSLPPLPASDAAAAGHRHPGDGTMSRTERAIAELLELFTRALGPTAGTPHSSADFGFAHHLSTRRIKRNLSVTEREFPSVKAKCRALLGPRASHVGQLAIGPYTNRRSAAN